MIRFFMKMMLFPVEVFVASMEAMTRTVRGVQHTFEEEFRPERFVPAAVPAPAPSPGPQSWLVNTPPADGPTKLADPGTDPYAVTNEGQDMFADEDVLCGEDEIALVQ